MQSQDYLSALPEAWQRSLRRYHIEPVERGMSGASLFHLRGREGDELYLKALDGRYSSELRSEVERTEWLGKCGIRVPRFVRVFDNESVAAGLMTAVPGRHPHEVRRPLPDLLGDLARGLHALHAVPAFACPFDETVRVRLAIAHEMIGRGLIKSDYFAERNQGVDPETLYRRLVRSIPENGDLVVVHGDATFDNLLIDDDGKLGFLDCGRAGRGDRYLDLSTVITDIEEHFGLSDVELFSSSYGKPELDWKKLEYFNDLYELF
jgi:aminoglycoside 3'-phosphotransferase II